LGAQATHSVVALPIVGEGRRATFHSRWVSLCFTRATRSLCQFAARTPTHLNGARIVMGFAPLNPSYGRR